MILDEGMSFAPAELADDPESKYNSRIPTLFGFVWA